ncbi:translocation/assembly module TamB domain-containing protein [Zhouia spongiae]
MKDKGKTISGIKKLRQILKKVLLTILSIIALMVIVFSLPIVQTKIAKKVTRSLNEKYNTNININRVGVSFLGNVYLKDVYIEDYKKDTLIHIEDLTTSLKSVRRAIKGQLEFGDVDITRLTLNIKTYKGSEDSNLDVFVEKLDSGPSDPDAPPFLLTASSIEIEDSKFRITDENMETPSFINYRKLNALVNDFKIEGPNVSTDIERLSFLGARGIFVERLQAGFFYSKERMDFENLNIQTPYSDVKGRLTFTYNREDFKEFTDKVKLQAYFEESTIALDEVNLFYNEFGKGKTVTLSSEVTGVLNSLTTKNLNVVSDHTRINGDFLFENLFESSRPFKIAGDVRNISSDYYQLKALLPRILGNAMPESLSKLGHFSIDGQTTITQNVIDLEFHLRTDIGNSYADMVLTGIGDIDNAIYKGSVSLDGFNIGTYMEDKSFGTTSVDLKVDGKGFSKEDLNTEIIGKVFRLDYNGYTYNNISVSGILKDQLFDGRLNSKDENFQVFFEGLADFSNEENEFNFIAEVDYADLNKLNFVKRDTVSIFKGKIVTDILGNTFDDIKGQVNFYNTTYINQNHEYFFEDFQISSRFEEEERIIEINSPDIIRGYVRGKFYYKDVGKLVRNSIGSIYTNYEPYEISAGQNLHFDLKIYNKIVDVFYPEIDFGKNTFIKGEIVADNGDFKLTFNSPSINAYGNILDNISLEIDNKNPLYNTFIQVEGIDVGFYEVSEFNLINSTIKDTLFFRTEFKGGKEFSDVYNLNFYHTFDEDQNSVIGLKKSEVGFKGNDWVINRANNRHNKVVFTKEIDTVYIKELVMNDGEEQIDLKGVLVDSTYKDIDLKFTNVTLDKITPVIDSLKLGGIVNGDFKIVQKRKRYFPSSSISIAELKANEILLGDLTVDIIGSEDLSVFSVDSKLVNEGLESLYAYGNLILQKDAEPSLGLRANIQNLNLAAFSPLGGDVITDIRGFVSGRDVKIAGPLSNLDIDGELTIADGGLKVPYLNVDANFNKTAIVKLYNQTFEFQSIPLTDTKYKTNAVLDGTISHSGFDDWYLDLSLNTNGQRFLVLDTQMYEDALYYGTGFISGEANIYGLADELTIKVEGTTMDGTSLKIPISYETEIGDMSFINFIDKNADAYAEKQRQLSGSKGLQLLFDLEITQEAEVEIVIDEKTGSILRGKGDGFLLIDYSANGFKMYGDYITYEGQYIFKYGGIIDKRFTVRPGGTINWTGDPLKADVNIQGVYSLYANPAVLLDNPNYTRKIETDVIINLQNELLKPDIEFDIEFPLAGSVSNAELSYKLDDKNKRELQALSLLAQGSFTNEANIDPSQFGYSNIAETASGILNNVLNSEDGKFNLGVNFERGERNPNLDYTTEDRVGVTVSTQLSDRVLINGKLGVPINSVSETVVAGDVEMQILLNEKGTLSARIFNKENEIQQFLIHEYGYTQGVGLSYQVDFNTFKELMHEIFRKKEAKKEATEQEDAVKEQETLGDGMVKFSSKKKGNN